MLRYLSHLLLIPVLLCACDNIQFRKLPEGKDIAFEGTAKKPQESAYRPGQARDVQLDLTSSDAEAKEAKFKVLSWSVAGGKQGTLDTSSISLGSNTLHYTPQEPGTHELTLKVAVEGEEESAKTIPCTIEAPAAEWLARGSVDNAGNLTLTISDAPEDWRYELWRIQSTRWSGIRSSDALNWPTQVQYGENTLPMDLKNIHLTRNPIIHVSIKGPDRTCRSISVDLKEACVVQLKESYGEEQMRTLREHNEAIRNQASKYKGNYTGAKRERAQSRLEAFHETTKRLIREVDHKLIRLLDNLLALRDQGEEDLAILETRANDLRYTSEGLRVTLNILKPMVDKLRESDQGPIDPWGVLYESLQQRQYEDAKMAAHLESDILDVRKKGKQGKTLLHLAVEKVALSRELINLDAEVEAKDKSGKNPMAYATEIGNQELIDLLLEAGAEPCLINKFGAHKWRKYFGEVGPEPPIPEHIDNILRQPCKIFSSALSEKKAYATHLLTLMPATVNGTPLTLNSFQKLLEIRKAAGHDNSGSYKLYCENVKEEFGDKACDTSYWVLMTRDVVPGSRLKTHQEQRQWMQNIAETTSMPYTLPYILEGVVSTLCYYTDTGKELFTYNSWTMSRCEVTLGRGFPIIFGKFDNGSLDVSNGSDGEYELFGVAATMR